MQLTDIAQKTSAHNYKLQTCH